MKLVIALLLLLRQEADARGLYFEIFGRDDVVAETTRITRCPPEIEDAEDRSGKLATCQPVGTGWLVGVTRGKSVDLELVRKDGRVAWRRTIEGVVAFATDTLLVFEAGKGYRAIWLSTTDGRTVRTASFTPIPAKKLPKWCGDEIQGVYRSSEATRRLAAVCLVYD